MAIKLNKTDEKGVITRYHRIAGLVVRPNEITIEVESYVNKDKRDEQAKTGVPTFYDRLAITEDFDAAPLFEMFYQRLLEGEQFKGGEKV